MATKRIFALDYGRGTMAGYWCNPLSPELFQPLMDDPGEPSGFARMKDGSYILGSGLYVLDGATFKQIDDLHVNIKKLPDGDDAVQIEYARAWLQRIKASHRELFTDCEEIWFIGCPTAEEWRHKDIVDKYRRIFERAGFGNPVIVPESNAALMCLERQYGGLLTKASNDTVGVLCVDLGAYSSDSTYVTPGKVRSFGGYSGASLIERMILARNLADDEGGKRPNLPETRKAVAAKCAEDATFAGYMLLHAKKLKENYFTARANGAVFSRRYCSEGVDLCMGDDRLDALEDEEFKLHVNDAMMQSILEDAPVRAVLGNGFDALPPDVREYLGDMTWAESLRKFLRDTLDICPGFAEAAKNDTGKKACLVLTGGASFMPFVEEIVTEMMPYASLFKDKMPMSTIAKGLLQFGPGKIKSMELLGHLEYIANHSENGDETHQVCSMLNNIVERAYDQSGGKLIVKTIDMMDICIYDQVNAWLRTYIDSDRIITKARSKFKYWFEHDMLDEYKANLAKTKNILVSELNRLYAPLLDSLHMEGNLISEDDFQLNYGNSLLEWWKECFDDLDMMIAEEDDFYKQFTNYRTGDKLKAIFACSGNWAMKLGVMAFLRLDRETYYRGKLETISNRKRNMNNEVICRFKPIGFCRIFLPECKAEIVNAIDKRTKQLNSKLLLEENFDDEE